MNTFRQWSRLGEPTVWNPRYFWSRRICPLHRGLVGCANFTYSHRRLFLIGSGVLGGAENACIFQCLRDPAPSIGITPDNLASLINVMPESLLRPEDTEQHLSMLRMSVDEALFQDHVSATFQIAKFAVRMTHIPKTEPVRHSSEVASFIVDRVVVPILSTTTNEEFWRVVSSGLKTYQRAVEAFHLAREMEMESEKIPASIEPPFTPDELFEGSASTLFGAPGAEEASFMCATMKRAAEMTSEIGAPRPDETAYAREFHLGATLFEIGTLAVVVAPSIQERTTKGTEGAFELARRGALEAYAAVRQVADLREAEKEDGDMSDLPFDDGDAELVDFYPL